MFITGIIQGSRVATILGTVPRVLFPLRDSVRVVLCYREMVVSWVAWRKVEKVQVSVEYREPISALPGEQQHLSEGAGSVVRGLLEEL